jgi:hypothetical protein
VMPRISSMGGRGCIPASPGVVSTFTLSLFLFVTRRC